MVNKNLKDDMNNIHKIIETISILKYSKVTLISTIDVYPATLNTYGLFKRFAEAVVKQKSGANILRCSMILSL
jgi:hypothetical protein